MKIKPLIKGLLTFIPGSQHLLPRRGTGGTTTAAYCYEIWLKHLTLLWESGLRRMPGTVAEIGPGDSLGLGVAAMLSGVDRYHALDIVKFSNPELNVRILAELVELFRARAPRPSKGWPDYDRHLDTNLFPGHILTDELLATSLAPRRIALIRRALLGDATGPEGVAIDYMVPWLDEGVIIADSVDLILSHSVLEHVDDLETTYRALSSWLKPGGRMSHQIDLSSHNLSTEWNGYRAYSEFLWKLMAGKRDFFINRAPASVHEALMKRHGFELICFLKRLREDGIPRARLSAKWKDISDEDLHCSEVFVQALKT